MSLPPPTLLTDAGSNTQDDKQVSPTTDNTHTKERPSTMSKNSASSRASRRPCRKVLSRPQEELIAKPEEMPDEEDPCIEYTSKCINIMHEYMQPAFVALCSILVVIVMCLWANQGLLPKSHLGHVHSTKTRVGHIHSPLYTTNVDGLTISLHGTGKEVFDIRMITMSSIDFGVHDRLAPNPATHDAAHDVAQRKGFNGTLIYRLLADGKAFYTEVIELSDCQEVEYFETIDVKDLGMHEAEHYTAEFTAKTSDGRSVAFLFQALRMSGNARYRIAIGLSIFVVTFVSIVLEKIHRSYSAFMGASSCLALLSAVQETPHLHQATSMIDFGTLMLLFSMMILMHMLASTGFFSWFAVQVVEQASKHCQKLSTPFKIFFLLTNICGLMSMLLDNVTVVLLTGPLTYQIAEKTKMGPRYLYLAMTICATIGGTATMIGDPPNIVIGSKMQIGFGNFVIVNAPLVIFVLLPVSSLCLWIRLKESVIGDSGNAPELDYKQLEKENRIKDSRKLSSLGGVLFGVFLALASSPFHGIEPAWFTMMGMMACAMMFGPHDMNEFLETVEWGTLFFFAILFVLVETLSELGVIREIGNGIINLIMLTPVDGRMYFAIFVVLWISALGSAFLESLPFTTTFVYILLDLLNKDIPGVQVELLVWPLSIGACVGGIGSIMGSSANLVCMAVSSRCAEKDEEKVAGKDFLKFGFPLLLLLMVFATLWLFLLFKVLFPEFGFELPLPGVAEGLC